MHVNWYGRGSVLFSPPHCSTTIERFRLCSAHRWRKLLWSWFEMFTCFQVLYSFSCQSLMKLCLLEAWVIKKRKNSDSIFIIIYYYYFEDLGNRVLLCRNLECRCVKWQLLRETLASNANLQQHQCARDVAIQLKTEPKTNFTFDNLHVFNSLV